MQLNLVVSIILRILGNNIHRDTGLFFLTVPFSDFGIGMPQNASLRMPPQFCERVWERLVIRRMQIFGRIHQGIFSFRALLFLFQISDPWSILPPKDFLTVPVSPLFSWVGSVCLKFFHFYLDYVRSSYNCSQSFLTVFLFV